MIYLDSSALLKLVLEEAESIALERWLQERTGVSAVSSELSRIEVTRATRRLNVEALLDARAVLDGLDLIPMGAAIVREACEVGEPLLRSLDAIHLASALSIRDDITAFIAYDGRLGDAARGAGLESIRPGA